MENIFDVGFRMREIMWIMMMGLVMGIGGCNGDKIETITGPQEREIEVWMEKWDNGNIKVEYQYYRDENGALVKHGYYREYAYFVDELITTEGNYIEGEKEGEWYDRCKPRPLAYIFENGDFEFGNFDGWRLEGARGNSIELVASENLERGEYLAKLTLYPGDIIRGGNRVELVRIDSFNYREERTYSWSFKIDKDYKEEPFWQTICQFHSQPDYPNGEDWSTYPEYKPPLSILYSNGICKVKLIPIDQTSFEIGAFEIEKGEWFDIYFQVKWSLHKDGYVEMYVNDRPVTPFNGSDYKFYSPNVNNEAGNYLKIGLYRDKRATEINTVYVDDLNIRDCTEEDHHEK